MTDEEIKLALFGVGVTLTFLSMRIFLGWEDKKINWDILHRKI
jgi:hypothetical protein